MATILFAAAGAALGAGFGGTLLGLSGAVIGRAIGATVGRAIDQRLLGGGSEPVEVGRLDRLHLMGAGEGAAVARVWGRMRVPAQVIWASPYREIRRTAGGGKGAPQPKVTQFSYTVSLALGLCEGEILGIGRIWADGQEISPGTLDLRVYPGSETQMPDPAIAPGKGRPRPTGDWPMWCWRSCRWSPLATGCRNSALRFCARQALRRVGGRGDFRTSFAPWR